MNKKIITKKIIQIYLNSSQKQKIIEIKDICFDLNSKNHLYYVFNNKGVFITLNYKKINFFMKNYMKDLIKIDFVYISEEF